MRKWCNKGLIIREEYLSTDRSLDGCQGLSHIKGKIVIKRFLKKEEEEERGMAVETVRGWGRE